MTSRDYPVLEKLKSEELAISGHSFFCAYTFKKDNSILFLQRVPMFHSLFKINFRRHKTSFAKLKNNFRKTILLSEKFKVIMDKPGGLKLIQSHSHKLANRSQFHVGNPKNTRYVALKGHIIKSHLYFFRNLQIQKFDISSGTPVMVCRMADNYTNGYNLGDLSVRVSDNRFLLVDKTPTIGKIMQDNLAFVQKAVELTGPEKPRFEIKLVMNNSFESNICSLHFDRESNTLYMLIYAQKHYSHEQNGNNLSIDITISNHNLRKETTLSFVQNPNSYFLNPCPRMILFSVDLELNAVTYQAIRSQLEISLISIQNNFLNFRFSADDIQRLENSIGLRFKTAHLENLDSLSHDWCQGILSVQNEPVLLSERLNNASYQPQNLNCRWIKLRLLRFSL